MESTVRRNILRYELTEEQRIALDEVWRNPCWAARPPGRYYNDDVEGEAELDSSTRCSSMTSTSSWSAEVAILSTSVGDSAWLGHRKTEMGPASSCKAFEETARTANELVEDDGFIDLGLDDWPVCEASDDSLECLSTRAIKIAKDGTGEKIASSCDRNVDDTVQEKMADIVGHLSYSLCCEEFVDGQSSTTMLVYFCAVLGISNDGSTFDRPRNYTPKLSALIHSARLVCLEAALPRHRHSHVGWDARPRTGQLEKLNHVRERFMCLGSQAPLGELLSLRSYGRAFSRTDGPSFRVR